ncbi:MAG: nuclear transport factor 2 family protein [Candidatus Cybelea sp.]
MQSPDPSAVLAEINRVWQSAAPDDIVALIRSHFTHDAVVTAPSLARVARGREQVAQSYADFVQSAKIIEVRIDEPQVDLFDGVAVATMSWRISYEFGGKQGAERGHDTYVFRLDDGAWRICWRSMLSAEDGAGS